MRRIQELFQGARFSGRKGDSVARRALVVDDSAVARSIIVVLLQRSGWEVIGASDGAEALRLAGAWAFDLVVTNPDPSKVPGLQLVRILKVGLASRAPRVILLVEPAQWVGMVGMLADEILVKNGEVEKQLHLKLAQLFGSRLPKRRIDEAVDEYAALPFGDRDVEVDSEAVVPVDGAVGLA